MQKVHEDASLKPRYKSSRILCPWTSCKEALPNFELLRIHLVETHDLQIEFQILEFASIDSFEEWKESIRKKDLAMYVLNTAPKKLSHTEAWNYFYNCHRSYSFTPKEKRSRSLKAIGSCKIGKACPSRIEVTRIGSLENPSSVKVKYWKTHVGHELHLDHVPLDSKIRAAVAEKLKAGLSFNSILNSYTEETKIIEGNHNQRTLKRKDLYNIVRDFNINYKCKPNKLYFKDSEEVEDNLILYYKEPYEEDENSSLDFDDYVLILMSASQANQLTRFGNNIICIESTHDYNAYPIQMYTIMTVDEFGMPCPVSFCFSTRFDEYIFVLFFNMVLQRVGQVNTKIFMSDDSPELYNAWTFVMGKVGHRLISTWHVEKIWMGHLNYKMSNCVNKKEKVYTALKKLLQLTNVNEFHTVLTQTLVQFHHDTDMKVFGDYLQDYCAHQPEVWAYCYHLRLGISASLKEYHNILRHIYLCGEEVQQLGIIIDSVMELAENGVTGKLFRVAKGREIKKLQSTISRHKASESIPVNCIEAIDESKEWLVYSVTDTSIEHCVSFVQDMCTDLCSFCLLCNICIHSFHCTCNDNTISFNICKHIHACAKRLKDRDYNAVHYKHDLNKASTNNQHLIKKMELSIRLLNRKELASDDVAVIEKSIDNIISVINKPNVVHPMEETVD